MVKIFTRLKYALLVFVVFIVGCTKSGGDISAQMQALYQANRFAGDYDKDSYRKPLGVLMFSGIKQGDKVIDLLGGGGYYTELFNEIVGVTGKVYIQNNSLFLRFSGEEINKRLNGGRLKNVERIDSEFSDMKLPQGVDIIFIGLSYHDIYVPRENPRDMADSNQFHSQILKSLRPGGKLIIIDHAAKPGSGIADTPKLHRIDEEWTKQALSKAGFTFVNSLNVIRNSNDNYDLDIWKKEVFYKTDRFIHLYVKLGE